MTKILLTLTPAVTGKYSSLIATYNFISRYHHGSSDDDDDCLSIKSSKSEVNIENINFGTTRKISEKKSYEFKFVSIIILKIFQAINSTIPSIKRMKRLQFKVYPKSPPFDQLR